MKEIQTDFEIKDSNVDGQYQNGKAVVYLKPPEEEPRIYAGIMTHEVIHGLLEQRIDIPLEEQFDYEWLIDEVLVQIGLWSRM